MKARITTNLSIEDLQALIKTAVKEAVDNTIQANLESTGLLDHKQIKEKYGLSRQTVFTDIENGTIPAVACTYKNGKRYISESMLDRIPKYLQRKKQV